MDRRCDPPVGLRIHRGGMVTSRRHREDRVTAALFAGLFVAGVAMLVWSIRWS